MNTQAICQSCGMPMVKPSDFGGGKADNRYCCYCTYPDGTLKPYAEKLEDMTRFIMSRMDLHETEARNMAKANLAKMPAWQEEKGL
jgi:hypothetical protein